MSEWWTYGLTDFLAYSPQTYYRLFELYNQDVWPTQLLALASGAAISALVYRDPAWQGRAIAAILAAAWFWVAWAYHLQRYATINWAATAFAAGFGIQAALLIWTGVIRGRIVFRAMAPVLDRAGLGIFVLALVVYPLIGPLLLGREWAQVEVFGIAPDPTVIATLGVLLLAADRTFWGLLIIPVLWCAVSGAILWAMGSPEAFVVPAAALLVILLGLWKSLRLAKRR